MAATLITENVVKEISTLSRESGQERLLECLGWQLLDPEDDLQKSIQFDFLYNNLEFCIHKGFAPSEICHLFELSHELLNCAQKGQQMTSALSIYKARCTELQAHVPQNTMKSFSEHFFQTFMKNYKIYEYVTLEQRHRQSSHLMLPINTPPATLPLSQGKEATVWNYMEKLNHLEEKGRQQSLKREAEREETVLEDRRLIDDAYEKLNERTVDSETQTILEIIKRAAGGHVSELFHSLQFQIENAVDDLTLKLDRNSLPRPAQMGPPTPYATTGTLKTKSPSSHSEKRDAKKRADKK